MGDDTTEPTTTATADLASLEAFVLANRYHLSPGKQRLVELLARITSQRPLDER